MTTSFPPINYPNKPVPPFTAEPPKNPFPGFFPDMWKNIKGKPYITVSSKGLANGLSEYFNDGADFGPDSLQADGSLTQTSGIKEAINYAQTNGITKVKLTAGKFVISPDLKPIQISTKFQEYNGTYGPLYAYISWGATASDSFVQVDIEGSGGLNMPSENSFVNYPLEGNTIIDASGLTNPTDTPIQISSGYAYYTLFGSLPNGYNGASSNFTSTTIKNLYIGMPTSSFISGITLYNANSTSVEKIMITPLSGFGIPQSSYTGAVTWTGTNPAVWGIMIDAEFGISGWINECQANSMDTGFLLGPHVIGGTLQGDGNRIQLSINGDHIPYILALEPQVTAVYNVSVSAFTQGPVHIGLIDGEDYTSTFGDIQDVVFESGGGGYGGAQVVIDNFHMEAANQTVNGRMPYIDPSTIAQTSSGQFYSVKVRNINSVSARQTLTLSANPPVSGTVYQNPFPYDIEIDLPVYATTAGTAGYVTIAKGATDTPTAISNQYVSGDTSSTSTQIIRLRVPAGWYYEFTGSGVTFGTATPFAE